MAGLVGQTGFFPGVRRAGPYHVKIQDLKPAGGYK
jgi:hypothetical protein